MGEMEAFFGCINSILKHVLPEMIHVVYCDAKVHHVDKFTVQDLPMTTTKLKRHGGGGTSFEPVFNYVAKHKLKPEVLLYMTDMYANFPIAPKYPVIWCATSDIKAPFGRTIEISE
jgi:predicted metal-dependent peptidase